MGIQKGRMLESKEGITAETKWEISYFYQLLEC